MSQRLQHANRNKTLSEKLFEEGIYFDWVVTTAFYASIHFVEHKLFVVDESECGYHSTLDYHSKKRCASPHDARLQLVTLFIPAVHRAYQFLDTASRNARYFDYRVNAGEAKKALERLALLSGQCV